MAARVVARLDLLLDQRASGRGDKKAILDSLGLGQKFFGVLRARVQSEKERIPLDKVFPIFEALGERPAVVMYEAARDLESDLPPLSQRSRHGKSKAATEDEFADDLVEKYDRLNSEDPTENG